MPVTELIDVVREARVIVCCGSGGVGKTTTAAALGLELARRGRRVVVVTIDPAKRLADALGLEGGLSNEPTRLDVDRADGELWAMMLDTRATFDALVRANAPDEEQAERILTNRFYRNVAGALGGTQEYMAAEKLHMLHDDDRFDVVVVDTPPTRNALDFLQAPGTLVRFLDHPLFRLLMLPSRSRGLRVLNVAAQPVLRTIGKVVGGDVLADAIDFFQAFEGMEAGFRRRADDVTTLLRSGGTRYVLVASPRQDTAEEARWFASRLREIALAPSALVVNRCTPRFAGPHGSADPDGTADRRPHHAELWRNLDELTTTADAERATLAPVVDEIGAGGAAAITWVPLLAEDVHDVSTLERVRELLFA